MPLVEMLTQRSSLWITGRYLSIYAAQAVQRAAPPGAHPGVPLDVPPDARQVAPLGAGVIDIIS